ncbi:MAG: hydroxymethylpyrimidine pyrophosphatase-like HAD family hydrolase [Phycisphaerales bacterium]|jgi:hydroxymethylpyrimidine pyrophosphatase-like HAD family hydrolase
MPIPNTIQAIVCDVDGCLSPEAVGPSDLASLATIRDWTGPPRTLCTGRPLPFVDAMARVVGALELPSVCEGGVWLFDPADYTWSMDPRITPGHLETVRECQRWVGETFAGVYFEAGKSAAVTVFHREGPEKLRVEIQPRIEAKIAEAGWPMRCSMTWTCINVELDFISKATGLDRFMQLTGFKPKNLVGIGDTMSDLPIREQVAWFACPANATDEIKAHADYVAQASEARGVIEILGMLSS